MAHEKSIRDSELRSFIETMDPDPDVAAAFDHYQQLQQLQGAVKTSRKDEIAAEIDALDIRAVRAPGDRGLIFPQRAALMAELESLPRQASEFRRAVRDAETALLRVLAPAADAEIGRLVRQQEELAPSVAKAESDLDRLQQLRRRFDNAFNAQREADQQAAIDAGRRQHAQLAARLETAKAIRNAGEAVSDVDRAA